jgi:hypothetical protein
MTTPGTAITPYTPPPSTQPVAEFVYVGPLTAETLRALKMSFASRVVRIEATDLGPAPAAAEGSATA